MPTASCVITAKLSTVIGAFQGHTAFLLRQFGLRQIWQKGFHDHVIRNADDHPAATAYVFENPV